MGTRQQQGEVAPSPAAPAPLLEVGAGPSCSCKHRSATAGTERVPPVCHGPLGVQHRALGVQHRAHCAAPCPRAVQHCARRQRAAVAGMVSCVGGCPSAREAGCVLFPQQESPRLGSKFPSGLENPF